ncbi:DNA-binding transcriptional regulator, AcrR family [Actinokineospora alba]|uniref:DNA-binding transcriptional regulator, AcrR family n=1 Tax=Actinokineospora alba TaxID=504798 RepID=A0A1H0QQL2_9PSEU|nr:TetR/AcrR family transcriptional regulator [Actinokineospora alba]TDP70465.1 AcrR family transcriptional regulator [Actinokineospora alba]SDI30998.1 DNA-binding transcriptional regulator, AcrR family [Actinokineospora alba]SDP18986.1 DNA-binding transcriptional regulator, AcrR family [Actinokineospora alba]
MVDPNPARARLIAAGISQLLEDGIKVLSRGLNVAEIAERAGVSEKTFFATFGDKGRYVDELLASLVEAPERVTRSLTDMVEKSFIQTKGDPRQTIRAVCAWDFQQVRQDPATLAQLATLVLAREHRGAMKKLRQAYAAYDDAGMKAYQAILARWGASLRAPFTAESMAVSLTALVEGLAVRHLADPTAVPDHLFGDVVVALIGSIVDTGQNHEHIDDVVGPLADEIMVTYEVALTDSLPEDPRSAVVDAARVEFAARGYFSTTLVHISVRSGVPLPVLKQLFPSKAMIVVSALRVPFQELKSQVGDDIALGITADVIVKRFLGRLATFAVRHIEYVEAFLMVVAHDTATAPETAIHVKRELDLPSLIEPVIAAGQRNGLFDDALASYDLAAALTNNLLLRCFTRRDDDPLTHAAVVGATCLRGLLVRDDDGG